MRINFSNPTLPFGEDRLPAVASVVLETRADGSPTAEALDGLNAAVGISIDLLRQDRLDTGRSIGADADPLNPLELTKREAAITAAWAAEDSARVDETDEESRESTLGTRVAAGVLAATGVGGGFAMVGGVSVAVAQPNQIPAPPAKVAQPFSFASASETQPTAEASTTAPTLTPAEKQECEQIATTVVPGPKKSGYAMYRPGIRYGTTHKAHKQQTVKGREYTQVLPDGSEAGEPDCADTIRVWESDRIQMQSAHNRSTWLNLYRQPKFARVNIDNPTGFVQVGPGTVEALTLGPGSDWRYNQCPDGKNWLKVRETTILYAQDIQTGDFIGSHKYTSSVPVRGGSCAAAARSARIADAKWKAETQ